MDCIVQGTESLMLEDMASGDAPDPTIIHGIPSSSSLPANDEEGDLLSLLGQSSEPPPADDSSCQWPTPDLDDSGSLITWRSDNPLQCSKGAPMMVGVSRSNCCLPVSSQPSSSMSLTLLRPLLSCAVCRVLPIQSPAVHTCWNGHQVCGLCYAAGHTKCEVCQGLFECRNEVLEGVLQRLRDVCPGLFPKGPEERQVQEDHSPRAVQHSSHRPLDCPHLACYRVVAANGFLAHFEFEHPSVPVFQMTPGYYIHFNLPAGLLHRNLPRVIAVIEVNVIGNKGCEVMEKRSLTPSFPVRRDAVICTLLCATVRVDQPQNSASTTDYLAAWCSSLYEDPLPLTYVLHARTPTGGKITYTGSMSSLHVTQDPFAILQAGECLVLAPRSYNQGTVPFDLKFLASKQ